MFTFNDELNRPGLKSWRLLNALLRYMIRDEQDMVWLYGNGMGPIESPSHDALMMKRQVTFFAARARQRWHRRIAKNGAVILPIRKVA